MSITDLERASQEDVLDMIDGGGIADAIAKITRWSAQEVRDLAKDHGYAIDAASKRFRPRVRQGRDKCHTCTEVDHLIGFGEIPEVVARRLSLPLATIEMDLRRHGSPHQRAFNAAALRARTGTGAVSASPVSNAEQALGSASAPAPVSPIRPAHRDLIDEGKAHSSLKVQRAAVKAEVALKALAAMVESTRLEEAAKRAAEKAKAEARAEVERLEQQLAEAQAKLRGPARAAAVAVVAPNQAGASAKEIRAWAAANGIDCPARGIVPAAVVDAYVAAQVAA